MKHARRILVIMGTRPEVIKCWPLVRALDQRAGIEALTLLTGQHKDLARQTAERLQMSIDVELDVMLPGQSLDVLTARLSESLAAPLRDLRVDHVLVQGDTTTAFVGALSAFYARIPVGHVEAGLRTDDIQQPFPEEMNRRLISRLAAVHFAPTRRAADALVSEGVAASHIHLTGNTGVDALRLMIERTAACTPCAPLEEAMRGLDGPIVAVTVHRRENREHVRGIASALRRLAARHPSVRWIVPVHPAPQVREVLTRELGSCPRCRLLPPLEYGDFVALLQRCRFVLTDSGGVQEEAPFLGKPVLVMRRTTERPEAVEAGVARLIGEGEEDIVSAATSLLVDSVVYQQMARRLPLYGDGHASERIVNILVRQFDEGRSGATCLDSAILTADRTCPRLPAPVHEFLPCAATDALLG